MHAFCCSLNPSLHLFSSISPLSFSLHIKSHHSRPPVCPPAPSYEPFALPFLPPPPAPPHKSTARAFPPLPGIERNESASLSVMFGVFFCGRMLVNVASVPGLVALREYEIISLALSASSLATEFIIEKRALFTVKPGTHNALGPTSAPCFIVCVFISPNTRTKDCGPSFFCLRLHHSGSAPPLASKTFSNCLLSPVGPKQRKFSPIHMDGMRRGRGKRAVLLSHVNRLSLALSFSQCEGGG